MGGYPSRFFAFFRRKDPRTPIKGIVPRVKNIIFKHYRGLFGFLVPLAALSWQGEKGKHNITVQCMWIWMAWFFLLQPVNVPVTGLIPIFLLPMAGVMGTVDTCGCYMNENVVLFMLGSMLLLLLNNTGVDRRFALWLIGSGDACQFSGKRLVFKSATAAFLLSMFCSKLIVTSTIIQFMAPAFMSLQASTARYRDSEPNYEVMRDVVCNAIQTASCIGSIVLPHASLATLAFRAMFYASAPANTEYPDIFNYFQYTIYAFPVAFLMHILNFVYHMALINFYTKPMSGSSMAIMRNSILKHKSELPKQITLHEKLSIFFTLFSLALFFTRWNKFLDKGWGDFRAESAAPEIPGLKDATVAAMFVIALHTLPKGIGFLKFITAQKKSQLPPIKPESAILWWRFVDKNLNYGYIFMLGCGVAISAAARSSKLGDDISNGFGKKFTNPTWNVSLLLVCLVAVVLANIMTSVAACAVWLPFVLNMSLPPNAPDEWQKNVYLGALGVGVGSSLGFMFPFLYTPAYFCHYTGKVPKKKMAKYAVGSAIICLVILWLSLCFFAPLLWDPKGKGITIYALKVDGADTGGAGQEAAPPPEP